MSIRPKVVEIIKSRFCVGREYDLRDEQSFFESRVIDSLGMIELVGLLEGAFSVKVEDEECLPENLDSINSIVAYLERKVGQSRYD